LTFRENNTMLAIKSLTPAIPFGFSAMNSINLIVGARIRQRRFQVRMNIADLARRAGISPDRLLRYEEGRERIPADCVARLCRALDMRPADIFAPPSEPEGAAVRVHHGRDAANLTQAVLVARQAALVAKLERQGCADLASIGRRLLTNVEVSRALFLRDLQRLCRWGILPDHPLDPVDHGQRPDF
jgi:transcriptional regulator with XRE-family HTH domain